VAAAAELRSGEELLVAVYLDENKSPVQLVTVGLQVQEAMT
jgi:hypothetical protein